MIHYLMSHLYRHHQDYDSARRYLDLSKQVLIDSEPGADTASVYYHEGKISILPKAFSKLWMR